MKNPSDFKWRTRLARQVKNPNQKPMDFMLPDSDWIAPTELPDLRGSVIAIDTETKDDGLANGRGPGWAHGAGRVVGVSMASDKGSVYIPIAHPDSNNFPKDKVAQWVQDHIDAADEVVFQNAPYDIGWLHTDLGLDVPEYVNDTIGMAYCLDEQRLTYGLDALCEWMGVDGKDESLLKQAASALGCDPKADLWRMPAKYVGPYADQDAVSTLELYKIMRPKLETQNVWDAYRLEMDLIPMVMKMRKRGVRIDTDRAEQVRDELQELSNQNLKEISGKLLIGRDVTIKDIRSPAFLEGIFKNEGIKYPHTTKGNASFQAEWMEKNDHWFPQICAKTLRLYDAGEKFVGNYIMDYTHLGRIHAEIHQFRDGRGGTKTSRLAYSDPPLQQMPSRNPDIASKIRGLFLPEEGEIWGALDYSQQEYRLIVHFAYVCNCIGADRAVQMYRDDPNTDFHSLAAEMTGLHRRKAKDVNFAKAFGAGVAKFALMTGMDPEEAASVMAQYDEELPFVKRLGEVTSQRAGQRGYLKLLDGARVRFDRYEPRWVDWNDPRVVPGVPMAPTSLEEARERTLDEDHPWQGKKLRRAFTHKSMNWLIQGSAARMTKLSMREVYRAGLLPLLQMHDELDFSFNNPRDAEIAEECMRDTVKLEVPVVVDAEFGVNWGKAKEDEDRGYGATFDEAWKEMQNQSR